MSSMTNVRNGSGLSVAARNAFGKSLAELDREAAPLLSPGAAHAVTIGGRPLDPKRDFGEHSLDATVVGCLSWPTPTRPTIRRRLDRPTRQQSRTEGQRWRLGRKGWRCSDRLEQKDDHHSLEDAIAAGSKSAPVYLHGGGEPIDRGGRRAVEESATLQSALGRAGVS